MNPIVAHRGWSSKAPENTLSAIKLALAEEKIDGIEIDIQMTKDGVLILAHDFILGRTSNGVGYISDFTYQELRSFDFGGWFGDHFTGEEIPRLEEVLEIIDGKKDLFIEIKKGGNMYPNIEKKLTHILNNYKHKDKIWVESFNHETVKEMSILDKELKTGLLIYGKPIMLLEQVKLTESKFVSINHYYITQNMVQELEDSNISLVAWTLNNLKDIEGITNLSEKIYITTDYPQIILDK